MLLLYYRSWTHGNKHMWHLNRAYYIIHSANKPSIRNRMHGHKLRQHFRTFFFLIIRCSSQLTRISTNPGGPILPSTSGGFCLKLKQSSVWTIHFCASKQQWWTFQLQWEMPIHELSIHELPKGKRPWNEKLKDRAGSFERCHFTWVPKATTATVVW